MTKNELSDAFTLAQSPDTLGNAEMDLFYGFGLPGFAPVYCTLRDVARLIRWQCSQLNGGWDREALQEIATHGRKRFQVIG